MGAQSRRAGKIGEREVGRLFLKHGYLFWRTQQNRGSVRDEFAADVSSIVPEHMLVETDDELFLDPYYIDRTKYPATGEHLISVDEFTPIPNLRVEVKKGYDAKTYNKQFQNWIDKLQDETPDGWIWALFYRRKYSSGYRVAFDVSGIGDGPIALTTNEEETIRAFPLLEKLARQARA